MLSNTNLSVKSIEMEIQPPPPPPPQKKKKKIGKYHKVDVFSTR